LYFLTTGIQWTPIYGKMATFSRYIAYIEPYFGFGVGLARTESASYVTFYPAVGIRAFFREWFSMKFEFRDYLYTENYQTRTNPPTAASALRNNYAVTLSLSFWLPKMPL
jgi:outer membrane beta-barrel protein